MEKFEVMGTKERVNEYVRSLQAAVGNEKKIKAVIDNHEGFVSYLKALGVPEDWTDRCAIVEMTKRYVSEILMDANAKVTDQGITYGEDNNSKLGMVDGEFYINNTGKEGKWIKFYPTDAVEVGGEGGYSDLSRDPRDKKPFKQKLVEFVDCINKPVKGKMIDGNGVVINEHHYRMRSFLGMSSLCLDEKYARHRYQKRILDRGYLDKSLDLDKSGPDYIDRINEDFGDPVDMTKLNEDVYFYLQRYPKYKAWFEARGLDITEILLEKEKRQSKSMDEVVKYSTEGKYDRDVESANRTVKLSQKIDAFYRDILSKKTSKIAFITAMKRCKKNEFGYDSEDYLRAVKRVEEVKEKQDEKPSIVEIPRVKTYSSVERIIEPIERQLSTPEVEGKYVERRIEKIKKVDDLISTFYKELNSLHQITSREFIYKSEVEFIKKVLSKIPVVSKKKIQEFENR